MLQKLLSNWLVFRLVRRLLVSFSWHLKEVERGVKAKLPTDGVVKAGPFRGLCYPQLASSGSVLMPKLIGSYEAEIQSALETCLAKQPELVINIGCGEGYYAVGTAMRLPQAQVIAFDLDTQAVNQCREMAGFNSVGDRVQVLSACTSEALQQMPKSSRLLVLCDCEGGELDLLKPEHFTSAGTYDILVELHQIPGRDGEREISERFSPTHEVIVIRQTKRDPAEYPVIREWSSFEQLLAMDELRAYPMSWLWIRSKR